MDTVDASLGFDLAGLVLAGHHPFPPEPSVEPFPEAGHLLFVSKRPVDDRLSEISLVLLGSTPSLHGRDLANACSPAVRMLVVDIDHPVLTNRARLRVAAFHASHAHLDLLDEREPQPWRSQSSTASRLNRSARPSR